MRIAPIALDGGRIVAAATSVIRRNPIKVGLNLSGLALLFLFNGLTPSPQTLREAQALLPARDAMNREYDARSTRDAAHYEYRNSLGFLWRCNSQCQVLKVRYERAEAEWASEAAANGARVHASKARLGLLSSPAVAEAKELFWSGFAGGMRYAKRASFWDALFVGARFTMGRDETMANFLATMFLRILQNVTVGIFTGVCAFLWNVVSVARAYASDPITGLLFFAACVVMGVSFFVSSVVVLGVAATATVVGAAQLAQIAGQQQRRPRNIHYD